MQGIPQVTHGQPVNLPVTGPVPAPLQIGEVVRGEVVNILPDAVSMRIKKEIILAKTDIPLRKGETYLLRVEAQEGHTVTLKVLQVLTGETVEAQSTLQNALNTRENLTHDQIAAIRAVLEEIPDTVREKLSAWGALDKLFQNAGALTETEGLLKTALDAAGIFFENKLRGWVLKQMDPEVARDPGGALEAAQIIREDLKGNLLSLKEALHDPEMANLFKKSDLSVETLETAADKLLGHIERQQIESKLNSLFQTFLPFVWQGLKDGKMRFKEVHHPQEGAAEYACVIHLDLERAGRLVAYVRLFADKLHLRFVAENAQFTELIQENEEALKTQLADRGMVCDSLRVTREEIIDFDAQTEELELDIKI